MKVSRKLVAILSIGLVAIVAAVITTNSNETLGQKVSSCLNYFQASQLDFVSEGREVTFSFDSKNSSRENLRLSDVECIASKLGFDSNKLGKLQIGSEGSLENERFSILWLTVADPTYNTGRITSSNPNFSRDWSADQGTPTHLEINIKDFR